jgi:hypothetical protein
MKFLVSIEMPFLVRKAKNIEQAKGIAKRQVGEKLNQAKLEQCDIDFGHIPCPNCRQEFEAVLKSSSWVLVSLVISMRVFKAESREHAERIALKSIGRVFPGTPLTVLGVQ